MRRSLIITAILTVLLGAALLGAAHALRPVQTLTALPTQDALPSLTPSGTPTLTHTPTTTATPTHTPTSTATDTPTDTPTLATRVLVIHAVMVDEPPTATPFPHGTILLPEPPAPVEPLPDTTNSSPPYDGWVSFESDHPQVQYAPVHWEPRLHREASRGQYHRIDAGSATFPFEGEGLRVRYVAARNMGAFELLVDGRVIDTIDARADELRFPGTRIYAVGPGSHTLTIRGTNTLALDAIQVFRGDAHTLIATPADTPTPSPTPRPAAQIEQVAGPPTAAGPVRASVVIAYDENGNREVDPAEGVSGVSVRIVAVADNRALAGTFTDARGYAQLSVETGSPVRVVVPYFGAVWDVTPGRDAAFTLLLEPGNQPGLIP